MNSQVISGPSQQLQSRQIPLGPQTHFIGNQEALLGRHPSDQVLGGPLHTVPLQMKNQINQFGVRSNTNSMFTILPNQNKAPLNAQPNLIRGDLNRAQFGVPQSAPIVRTLGSSPCIRLESANQSVRSSQIVGGQNLNHIPSFSSQPLVKFAPPLPPRPAQGPLNTNVRVGGQPVLGGNQVQYHHQQFGAPIVVGRPNTHPLIPQAQRVPINTHIVPQPINS